MRHIYYHIRYRWPWKKILVSALSACLVVVGSWRVMSALFRVNEFEVKADSGASVGAAAGIRTVLRSLQKDQSLSLTSIVKALPRECPYVRSVVASLVPCNRARITVQTHAPYCMLGQEHVLLVNGVVIPRAYVSPEHCAQIPRVQIQDWYAQKEDVPTKLPECILSFDPGIFETYNVIWRGEHEVLFEHKKTPTFCVLSEASRCPDVWIRTRCEEIRQVLADRAVLETPSRKRWIADVRFREQIIVFVDKGGWSYGAHIS